MAATRSARAFAQGGRTILFCVAMGSGLIMAPPRATARDIGQEFEDRIAQPITVGMGPSLQIFGDQGVFRYTAKTATAANARKPVFIYDCRRLAKPPALTGTLSDPVWKDLPPAGQFVQGVYDGPPFPAAVKQTSFRVGYDDDNLYVGIDLVDPDVSLLKASHTQYDSAVWWDDTAEIYVEPGFTHRRNYKFVVNPIGTRFDAYTENTLYGRVQDDGWGAGTLYKAKSGRDSRGWYIEMQIPFSDLGASSPKPSGLYSFQIVRFCRTMKNGGMEYSSWAPGGNFSTMELFGYLIFSAKLDELEGEFHAQAKRAKDGVLTLQTGRGELSYIPFATLQAMEIARANQLAQDAESLFAGKKDRLTAADQKELAAELETIRQAAAQAAQANTRTISETVGLLVAKCDVLANKLRLAEIVASYSAPQGGQ